MDFPNVFKMLNTVMIEKGDIPFFDYLKKFMKVHKYYPMLQIKKVFKSKSLILLHNTYKRSDISHFKELYDEARSVIIDINKPVGENIVVSLADKIPEDMLLDEYMAISKDTDIVKKAYEGTMIYVYCHENTWYFSTSTIPDIDYSRYFHPTKTHGQMFDEAIGTTRKEFVLNLLPEKAYGFLLVHHENRNIMNYTLEFGENYCKLIHIFTREGATTEWVNDNATVTDDPKIYGFIVRTVDGEIYKVCRNEIFDKENKNRGNSNIWVNLIDVYMKGVPHYKVVDYINEYAFDKKDTLVLIDDMGRQYEPTYIIHEVFRNMCETIYRIYRATTNYNKYTGRYFITKNIEDTLAPIVRFHMSQLRIIQITSHKEAPITPRIIRDYICHNQTMKNIRMLISHFSKMYLSQDEEKIYKSTMCFYFLNNLLHN